MGRYPPPERGPELVELTVPTHQPGKYWLVDQISRVAYHAVKVNGKWEWQIDQTVFVSVWPNMPPE
jgi:hypothetical protein